jgi:RNA polymerase sigma-70 factor (ECF subfamily)
LKPAPRADVPERAHEGAACFAALRAGDRQAFGQIYETYRARLYTFLLRLAQDEHEARDLSQEAWCRLAAHARALRPDTDVGAWLFTVARNLFRSRRRFRLLDRQRLREWGLAQASDAVPSPLVRAEAGEAATRLERALAQLPLRYREVLMLYAIEGYRSAQIARMLALDEAAVRKRLERARSRLREQIGVVL